MAWTRVSIVGANVISFAEPVSRGTYNYRVQAFNSSTGRTSSYSNTVQVRVK